MPCALWARKEGFHWGAGTFTNDRFSHRNSWDSAEVLTSNQTALSSFNEGELKGGLISKRRKSRIHDRIGRTFCRRSSRAKGPRWFMKLCTKTLAFVSTTAKRHGCGYELFTHMLGRKLAGLLLRPPSYLVVKKARPSICKRNWAIPDLRAVRFSDGGLISSWSRHHERTIF
jgi:hypothetical protein